MVISGTENTNRANIDEVAEQTYDGGIDPTRKGVEEVVEAHVLHRRRGRASDGGHRRTLHGDTVGQPEQGQQAGADLANAAGRGALRRSGISSLSRRPAIPRASRSFSATGSSSAWKSRTRFKTSRAA